MHAVQYMTHRNRWGVLERGGQLLNLQSASRIVPLLCSMAAKWEREREEAGTAVTAILWTLLQSHGITAEQVSRVGAGPSMLPSGPSHCAAGCHAHYVVRASFLAPSVQAMERLADRSSTCRLQLEPHGPSPAAEYGLLRMRLLFVSSPGMPGLPPAICLLPGGNPSQLLPGKPARSKAETRIRTLEGQLFEGLQPGLDDSRFLTAAAAAAGHEIQRRQAAITSFAQQVHQQWQAVADRCSVPPAPAESISLPASAPSAFTRRGLCTVHAGATHGYSDSQALWPPSRSGEGPPS